MNLIKLFIFCTVLLAAATVHAKSEKVLVCHVGSATGPQGETWLDDPDCVPGEDNGYFCPDAGKIDLIVVPANANHLDNPSHEWAGIADYDPIELGASGQGTEDSNGDGIDDGCELSSPCPCWNEAELQQVTADNQLDNSSCDNPSVYPLAAQIQDDQEGVDDGVEGGFTAGAVVNDMFCNLRDAGIDLSISETEAMACIEQIARRCAAIGAPITGE